MRIEGYIIIVHTPIRSRGYHKYYNYRRWQERGIPASGWTPWLTSKVMAGSVPGCIHFNIQELAEATNNFDKVSVKNGGCKLGEGGFGPVYKGRLRHTEVAIKILRKVPKVSEG